MDREHIISLLQSHRQEIARLDVASLHVFGSVARDQARADSDVDILVRFIAPATFDRYIDLKALLVSITGRPIDLVTEDALRPEMRSRIVHEAVLVV